MAKDTSEKRDKKEKKEKKEKRSESDGVKKSKKDKKSKLSGDNVAAAFEEVTKTAETPEVESTALIIKEVSGELAVRPIGALVPFANPLADEKVTKKVLKSVKKGGILRVLQNIQQELTLLQRPSTKPSNVVSRKSSKLCGNLPKEQPILLHPVS
jgi:H/ACA ribonucleoprotein complex subunit 2